MQRAPPASTSTNPEKPRQVVEILTASKTGRPYANHIESTCMSHPHLEYHPSSELVALSNRFALICSPF